MHECEFGFECALYFVTKPRRRFYYDVNHELAPRVRQVQLLFLKFLYRLLNPIARVRPDVCALVQHPVNSRHSKPCLECDFLNQEAMSQFDHP